MQHDDIIDHEEIAFEKKWFFFFNDEYDENFLDVHCKFQ